jgi:hypothetical protein
MEHKIEELVKLVREVSFDIHLYFGHGHLEKVYENTVILGLKKSKTLAEEHEAQILGYLKSTRMEHGILINFGSYKFQIKKYIWTNDRKTKNLCDPCVL